MGVYQTRPMTSEVINRILDNGEHCLTGYEVETLYTEFNSVVKMRAREQNDVAITSIQKGDPITVYKLIAYFNGKVIAFRVGLDPKPYILFQYNNSEFKQIVKVLELHRSDINTKENAGYERIQDTDEFVIKLLMPRETSRYSLFYWVLDATNSVS